MEVSDFGPSSVQNIAFLPYQLHPCGLLSLFRPLVSIKAQELRESEIFLLRQPSLCVKLDGSSDFSSTGLS